MPLHSISQVAHMAGVSVRTLQYYDRIGLLKPTARTDAGYRQYNRKDLLRLQQILLFKSFEYPIKEITQILNESEFDVISSLKKHRDKLNERQQYLQVLTQTVDKTLTQLDNSNQLIEDEELFYGFARNRLRQELQSISLELADDNEEFAKEIQRVGAVMLQHGSFLDKNTVATIKPLGARLKIADSISPENENLLSESWQTLEEKFHTLLNGKPVAEVIKGLQPSEPAVQELIADLYHVMTQNGLCQDLDSFSAAIALLQVRDAEIDKALEIENVFCPEVIKFVIEAVDYFVAREDSLDRDLHQAITK